VVRTNKPIAKIRLLEAAFTKVRIPSLAMRVQNFICAKPASVLLLVCVLAILAGCTPGPIEIEDFSLKLSRDGQCFNCPWYTVSVLKNGLVHYQGIAGTEARGDRFALLSPDSLEGFALYLLQHNIFGLENRYDTRKFYDGSTTTIAITINGKTKSITDHFGAPDSVHAIERYIDELTGAKSWVGEGAPLPSPNTKAAKAVRNEIDSLEALDDELLQRYESLRQSGELRQAFHLFYNERKLSDSINKAYQFFALPKHDSLP